MVHYTIYLSPLFVGKSPHFLGLGGEIAPFFQKLATSLHSDIVNSINIKQFNHHHSPLQLVETRWLLVKFLQIFLSDVIAVNILMVSSLLVGFISMFISFRSFFITLIHVIGGLPGGLLPGVRNSFSVFLAGVSGCSRIRCPSQFSLRFLMFRLHGVALVISYRFTFDILVGQCMFNAYLSCFLWNASICSSCVLFSVQSSLLYRKMLDIYAVKVLIFKSVLMFFDVNMYFSVFMASMVSIFRLWMSLSVCSMLPSNLHFFQSGVSSLGVFSL